jgi:hypothetical protein
VADVFAKIARAQGVAAEISAGPQRVKIHSSIPNQTCSLGYLYNISLETVKITIKMVVFAHDIIPLSLST